MFHSQVLRSQLQHLKGFLFTCKDPIAEDVRRRIWPREYLWDDIHQYSLLVSLNLKIWFYIGTHCRSHVEDKGKWTWLEGWQPFFLVEGGRGVKFYVCFGRGRLYLSHKYFITPKKYTGICYLWNEMSLGKLSERQIKASKVYWVYQTGVQSLWVFQMFIFFFVK